MSAIREARRPNASCGREEASAPRLALGRWSARALGAALIAAALWGVYGAVSAFFYRNALAAPVKRADLTISVTGNGVIESGDQLDVKSRVRGWSSILEIVPNGSYVEQGDLLVRLGSTSLEDEIAAERATLVKVEAAIAQAKKQSEAAAAAIEEYREGTYVEQRLQLSRDIVQARQKLSNSEHSLVQEQILYRRGFASQFQLKTMELAVEKAKAELSMAKTKKEVLEKFTREKTLAELTGARDAAEARWRSQEIIVQTQTAKLAKLQEDLKHCEMRAPRDGMAIYATEAARRLDGTEQPGPEIYPGVKVRQFQTVVHLARLERMQVRMLVPEDRLSQLHRGQRARLRVLDEELHGEVASISDLPAPAAEAGEGLNRYAIVIAIAGGSETLKPGMSAEVEIFVKQKKNALVIPVICVSDEGGKPRVWLKKQGRVLPREVVLGIANDALVEVIDGVAEDDQVLLNWAR